MSDHCKWCKRIRENYMSDNSLENISLVTEFNDIHTFMQDEDVDRAMDLLVKLLVSKGAVPPEQARRLIVEMQALSTKFALLATYYATIGKAGSQESHKKNVYFTLRDALTKLVDAIKYTAKVDFS